MLIIALQVVPVDAFSSTVEPLRARSIIDIGDLPAEIPVEAGSTAPGTERFAIPLEAWRSTDDYAEFDVTATADVGWTAHVWDADSPETSLPVLTAVEPPPTPELELTLTRDPSVASTSPGLLRVRIDFHDRDGWVGDESVLLQFVEAGDVLIPITFDDYVNSIADMTSDDNATAATGTPLLAGASVAGDAGPSTMTATGTGAFLWGSVAFWDTRPRYDEPGSRYPTCDVSDTSCDVGAPGCCFSALQAARVKLYRHTGGAWHYVGETGLDANGHYFLAVSDYDIESTEILVDVVFDQGYVGGLGLFQLSAGDNTGAYSVYEVKKVLPTSVIDLGRFLINAGGDTMSQDGDVASAWETLIDADQRLSEDGETSQRAYPTAFRIVPTLWAQDCTKGNTFEEFIQPGEARTTAPARAMGLALLSRVVGCDTASSSWPEFPVSETSVQVAFKDHLFDSDTGEGIALLEAIPELVALLTWWDPATATWTGMKATHAYKCRPNSPTEGYCDMKGQWVVTGTSGKSNSNNLSYYRNNAYALWNLIDASQGEAYYCKPDTVDLTVHDLMVALWAFENGPHSGGNGDANEMGLTDPYGNCTDAGSEGCLVHGGDVCGGTAQHRCYTGDPHGTNLRDWLRYLPSGESAAVSAITSQECVGIEDHSYPFRGGFHGD